MPSISPVENGFIVSTFHLFLGEEQHKHQSFHSNPINCVKLCTTDYLFTKQNNYDLTNFLFFQQLLIIHVLLLRNIFFSLQ